MDEVVTTIAAADLKDAWWQYGAIAIIAFVLALVVRYLYTRKESIVEKKDDQIAKEREGWANERVAWQLERQKMISDHIPAPERARGDYEEELHKHAENYAQRLRDSLDKAQAREDSIRKEFAEVAENIAAEIGKMSGELTRVLDKLYERFIGPRRHY